VNYKKKRNMDSKNVNEIIENYLNGTASEEDKERLSSEMRRDPALAREVELRRRTNMILADRSIMELRSRLDTIEMKRRSSGPVRRSVFQIVRYAAAVASVALITSLLYLQFREVSQEKLLEQYYLPYETSTATRSLITENNVLMKNALESYQAHEYRKAIGFLELLLSTDPENMETVFMHGMANMEERNYPVASNSFTRVVQQNDNLYIEDASWYLGLCYMMNEETDKAIRQFEYIAGSKSRYSKDARKLAKKLR